MKYLLSNNPNSLFFSLTIFTFFMCMEGKQAGAKSVKAPDNTLDHKVARRQIVSAVPSCQQVNNNP